MGSAVQQKPEEEPPKPAAAKEEEPKKPATKGEGVKKAEEILATDSPSPKKLAELIWKYPAEKEAILEVVQSKGGNGLCGEVLEKTKELHIDWKGKNLVAGEPDKKDADFFIAGAGPKGVKWRKGDNEGTIDGKGLDNRQHLDGGDIHTTAGEKGGKIALGVGYEAKEDAGKVGVTGAVDPKTMDYTIGVNGEKQIRPGEKIGAEISGGSQGVGFKTSQSTEKDGDKASSSQGIEIDKDGKAKVTTSVAASSKDGLSVSASHVDGEKDSDKFAVDKKFGDAGSVGGSVGLTDSKLTAAELHGKKNLGDGITGSASLGFNEADGKKTVSGSMGLEGKDWSTSLSGKASDDDTGQLALKAAKKVGEHTNLSAEAGIEQKDAETNVTAALAAVYSSPRFHISGDLKLRNNFDGTEVTGSGAAVYALKPGLLYGTAFGQGKLGMDGKFTGVVGGGLTLTPHDHVALTASGVIDPATQGFDARLSVDIFTKKIDASTLAPDKKKSAISIFAGVRGGSLTDSSYLGDRGKWHEENKLGSGGVEGYVGVGWSF